MNNALVKEYLSKKKTLDDKNYLFATIAYNIAPTIAKEKPASLLNLTKGIRNLHILWEKYKQDFMDNITLEYYEIRKTENSTLVLFYNPKFLYKVLFQENNIAFLEQFGYSKEMTLLQCLEILKNSFAKSCPHEIGVFLGIPVEDVISFIKLSGRDCLLCGYWKVYHNPNRALSIFKTFDRAKFKVLNHIANGAEPFCSLN